MNIEQVLKDIKKQEEEFFTKQKEVFNQVIEYIFNQDDRIRVIGCTGYTPGFNDGDPCTHSQEFWINEDENYKPYLSNGQLWDGEGNEPESYEYKEFEKYIDILKQLENVIERMYNTDFHIVWYKEDGKVVMKVEDYYCGY